jgi:hypothetical protein
LLQRTRSYEKHAAVGVVRLSLFEVLARLRASYAIL